MHALWEKKLQAAVTGGELGKAGLGTPAQAAPLTTNSATPWRTSQPPLPPFRRITLSLYSEWHWSKTRGEFVCSIQSQAGHLRVTVPKLDLYRQQEKEPQTPQAYPQGRAGFLHKREGKETKESEPHHHEHTCKVTPSNGISSSKRNVETKCKPVSYMFQ